MGWLKVSPRPPWFDVVVREKRRKERMRDGKRDRKICKTNQKLTTQGAEQQNDVFCCQSQPAAMTTTLSRCGFSIKSAQSASMQHILMWLLAGLYDSSTFSPTACSNQPAVFAQMWNNDLSKFTSCPDWSESEKYISGHLTTHKGHLALAKCFYLFVVKEIRQKSFPNFDFLY